MTQNARSTCLQVGDLEVDPDKWIARFKGRKIQFPKRVFLVIHKLAQARGEVVGHERIVRAAYDDRQVKPYTYVKQMSRVRKNLAKHTEGAITVEADYSIGYRLVQLADRQK